MNPRVRPFRAAVVLAQLLVFLAMQLVDGSGAHGCPEHDGAAPVHGAAVTHAGHGGPAPEAPGHGGGCTCLGTCHGSAFSAIPSVGPGLPVPAALAAAALPAAPSGAPRVFPRLLPFAVGPPALS